MNLRQLKTFVTIGETGGFAGAEGQLQVTQSAASRQIQALEAELGIPLFDRIGRRIKLTSEGEDLLRHGRRVLNEVESFIERARVLKSGDGGTLRVGGSTQHIENLLADFVPRYRRKHPSVEIDLIEDGGARIPERLERGDIHLGLITTEDENFGKKLLAPVYVLAIVSAKHRYARKKVLDVAELAEEPLLLLRRHYGSRGWFDHACHMARIKPRVILESAAPHTLLALARSGDNIAIVPSNVRIPSDSVRALPLIYRGAPIGRWCFIAWQKGRYLAPYAEQFMDELVDYSRKNYPGLQLLRHAPPLPRPKETGTKGGRSGQRSYRNMVYGGAVGYVFKKLDIPLAPFTLALVLGNRAESSFRLSMIGSGGDLRVFWSNWLVGTITTLALILLFWPLISQMFERVSRLWRPAAVMRTPHR